MRILGSLVLFSAMAVATGIATAQIPDAVKAAKERAQQQIRALQQQKVREQDGSKPRQGNTQAQAPTSRDSSEPTVPADCCTQEATAKIAATAPAYDIVGIKLGMSIKDALLALKAYNPNFRVKPDSVKYDVLPYALTYGISAMSPAEKFYFLATMPPNQGVVSTVGRYINFTKENAPTQQVVVEEMKKKYGEPSWDRRDPNGGGMMLFVDDKNGARVKREQLHGYHMMTTESFQCNRIRAFYFGDYMAGLGVYPPGIDSRVENGVKDDLYKYYPASCWDLTMIQVYLFGTMSQPILDKPGHSAFPWGRIVLPDVVGSLLVMMGHGPLDRSGTMATHKFLMEATKGRDAKAKDDAAKNRPKF
jgi:hypothetical protein